jgi:hypothetical protein
MGTKSPDHMTSPIEECRIYTNRAGSSWNESNDLAPSESAVHVAVIMGSRSIVRPISVPCRVFLKIVSGGNAVRNDLTNRMGMGVC